MRVLWVMISKAQLCVRFVVFIRTPLETSAHGVNVQAGVRLVQNRERRA